MIKYEVTKEKLDELAKNIEKWPYYQVNSLFNWFEKNLVEVTPKARKRKVEKDVDNNA